MNININGTKESNSEKIDEAIDTNIQKLYEITKLIYTNNYEIY